jgi:zinc protease
MSIASTKPQQLTLSNGIPVVIQHQDAPVAATYWWVRVGSADEAPSEAGFAHFLEHMLFKDAAAKETGKASTGRMARAIESLGGDINAYTSFDQTVYHVTCAAHHWEKVLDAFGPMAKPQKFLKSDFEREREVILEEWRKNNDSPGRQLFQGLFTATFAKHPYGRPVIGYPRTLNAATVGTLERFYRRHYVSGNMGIVLVGPTGQPGDERHARILKLLEKHFGGKTIPKKPYTRGPRPAERPLHAKPGLVVRKFDVKTPTLAVSFRAPSLLHEDTAALDLMGGILGMGELSRLYQALFYQNALVTDASGGLYTPLDDGMLYFQAELADMEKLRPAGEQMLRELARLREELVTEEELGRVRVNSESERLYATQTADGMAGRLGFLKYIVGDMDFDQEYLDQLNRVDARVVRETARRYFDWRRMSLVLLLPKDAPDFDLKPLAELAERLLPGPEAPAARAAKKVSGPRFFTLPSGIRFVHHEKAGSHVASVQASALGGLRLELGAPLESAQADWGASYMMSLTWTKGTESRDARAIARAVEGRAAGLDGFAGRNSVGLSMTCLARDWTPLSELFTDALVRATFPEAEVDHSRRVAEDQVRGIEDHTSQLCSKLFLETLYERHPYGHLSTGSLESLGAMRSAKLKAFHQRWIRPDRLVIAAVGALKTGQLEAWIENLELAFREAGRGGGNPAPEIAPEPPLKAPRWVERHVGREQTHILVGGLGLTLDSEDRYPVRLLQTLLGGQSGRLFIELREKKSLAYTVAPINVEGVEPGYIGTYIACAPGKRQESIEGIRHVLEELARKGPTAAEMRRAQEFYLGRRAMDLQSDSSLAGHYGLEMMYGLPRRTEEEIARLVNRVTARQVQAACRKYLVERPMVTAVVG